MAHELDNEIDIRHLTVEQRWDLIVSQGLDKSLGNADIAVLLMFGYLVPG